MPTLAEAQQYRRDAKAGRSGALAMKRAHALPELPSGPGADAAYAAKIAAMTPEQVRRETDFNWDTK